MAVPFRQQQRPEAVRLGFSRPLSDCVNRHLSVVFLLFVYRTWSSFSFFFFVSSVICQCWASLRALPCALKSHKALLHVSGPSVCYARNTCLLFYFFSLCLHWLFHLESKERPRNKAGPCLCSQKSANVHTQFFSREIFR